MQDFVCMHTCAYIHTHTEMHTDTQRRTHRHRYTHTHPAISTVIQQAPKPDSSSFSEPLKGNHIWGRKGMSHTEVKRYINVHLQNGQYTYVIENTISIRWNAICDGGSAKRSPRGFPGSPERLPSPSWSHSPLSQPFPQGLCSTDLQRRTAITPTSTSCNHHHSPYPSLFLKFCLQNSMLYSKNLK